MKNLWTTWLSFLTILVGTLFKTFFQDSPTWELSIFPIHFAMILIHLNFWLSIEAQKELFIFRHSFRLLLSIFSKIAPLMWQNLKQTSSIIDSPNQTDCKIIQQFWCFVCCSVAWFVLAPDWSLMISTTNQIWFLQCFRDSVNTPDSPYIILICCFSSETLIDYIYLLKLFI